ncbi:TPA: hypothetical protein M4K80_004469, partial [Salmonella enterica]|nr:hypothetical protein [Salmonella enterica]
RGFIQVNIFLPAEASALTPAFPHPFPDAAAQRVVQVTAFQQGYALLLTTVVHQTVPVIVVVMVYVASAIAYLALILFRQPCPCSSWW